MIFTLCEQLELMQLRRKSAALLFDIQRFVKTIRADDDGVEALEKIYQAMQNSETFMAQIAENHRLIFVSQMRQLGAASLLEKEPYVDYEAAKIRLEYLQKLDALFVLVEQQFQQKSIDASAPIVPQIERIISEEQAVAATRLTQILDENRQRNNGVRRYIWRTQYDGKVRPTHAANDDKIFAWDAPPETGHPGAEFGCRCFAEPLSQEAAPNPSEVQVVGLPALAAFALLAAKILSNTAGKVKKLPKKTPEKPASKPEINPLPKSPKLDDTKTWPKPPTKGKLKEGNPSRAKPTKRGEKSLYDEKGGEWRYSPADKFHNEHWDYKPPGRNKGWENVPIGDKTPIK